MKRLFAAIAIMLSCTDEERTHDILEAQGYTDVEVIGYGFGKCAESDSTCTTFRAISQDGKHVVRGAVGCGRHGCSKACTVRITSVSTLRLL